MSTEIHLIDEIRLCFPAESKDVRSIAPLKLAYLGDAVFEIIVRTIVLDTTGGPVKNLHSKTSSLVNAASQASLAAAMQEKLNEEEAAMFRHGRNAKTSSVAKHADIHDYRNATGLEALFGYLYLTNQTNRAIELLKYALEKTKGDLLL
jgi:ribonuclease-3 family protein